MAYQETLPKQQIGSLGTEKIDRTTVVNLYKDTVASEVNLSAKCIEELFERIGLYDGSTTGSIEERYHPAMFTYDEPFICGVSGAAASNISAFDAGGLSEPVYAGDVGGGIYFQSFDDQYLQSVPVFSSSMEIYHSQYVKISSSMANSPIITFNNTDTSYAYGVIATGSSTPASTGSIIGFIYDGASFTYTNLGTYTWNTEFCLRTKLIGKHFYGSVDFDSYTDCGEIYTQKYYVYFISNNTGKDENWKLKLLKIRALFNEPSGGMGMGS